jgi:hypothetical protein
MVILEEVEVVLHEDEVRGVRSVGLVQLLGQLGEEPEGFGGFVEGELTVGEFAGGARWL